MRLRAVAGEEALAWRPVRRDGRAPRLELAGCGLVVDEARHPERELPLRQEVPLVTEDAGARLVPAPEHVRAQALLRRPAHGRVPEEVVRAQGVRLRERSREEHVRVLLRDEDE